GVFRNAPTVFRKMPVTFRWRWGGCGRAARASWVPSVAQAPAQVPPGIDLDYLHRLDGPRLSRPGSCADEVQALPDRRVRRATHIRRAVAALLGLAPEGDLLRHVLPVEHLGAAVVEVAGAERHTEGREGGDGDQPGNPVPPPCSGAGLGART